MSGSRIYDTTVVEVEPLSNLCLRIRFRDDTEGQVESPYGQWDYPGGFSAVRILKAEWPGGVDTASWTSRAHGCTGR